jgi:SAM-dependent methyltransferase
VTGKSLLDLGAGEGWVAQALGALVPAWSCGVDVGPFLLARWPYVIYDGARLPFRDGTFDTTLLSLVLHHCEAPEVVLEEAIRVTRTRLLVVESIHRSARERFWLDLLDRRLNRHRHGGTMNVPGAFRRPEEWRALFESHDLRLIALEWLGGRLERLVHHPLLFVMDKAGSRGHRPTREERERTGPSRARAASATVTASARRISLRVSGRSHTEKG